jgi:DNA-binding transcriptional ArsR family regulator
MGVSYSEKDYPIKEYEVLRLLVNENQFEFRKRKPRDSRGLTKTQITKKLTKQLGSKGEYNSTIGQALHSLAEQNIVEEEKNGKYVYCRLSDRGKKIAELILGHMKLVKPLYLTPPQACIDSRFSELKSWLRDSQTIIEENLSKTKSREPLRFKENINYCGNLLFDMVKATKIDLDQKGEYSSSIESINSILNYETDLDFVSMISIKELEKNDPQSLKDLTALCIFGTSEALSIENPSSSSTIISSPKDSTHRLMLAEDIARKRSIPNSDIQRPEVQDMIKGCMEGEYKTISLNAPFDTLLQMQYGFSTPLIDRMIVPVLLVVSKSAVEKKNRNIKKLHFSLNRFYQKMLKNKLLQYKHALSYVVTDLPTKFSKFKEIIPVIKDI